MRGRPLHVNCIPIILSIPQPAGGEHDGPPSSESRTAEGTGHGAASPGGSGGSLPPVETVESESHEEGGGAQPGMPPLQPSDVSPGLSRRRGSHHLTKSNSLAVPDGLGEELDNNEKKLP